MRLTATLSIMRGMQGHRVRQTYRVGYESGESVLDALCRIRSEQDATLAFRYSCINANACKECMLLLDGKVVYACTARLEPREMTLEPLPNKALIRDLATEIAPPDERILRFFPAGDP
jgi:succinate dehydrogenase/fumarate reductase-like Fe-S protein